MVSALKNSGTDPTYLEFFGLTRPPFAQFCRPSQMFDTEQHSLLMAHLTNATKQTDCLVVICGADGSGKTTLLNRYIASLHDDISLVTINETCSGDKHFYLALLRQLGFSDITGTPRELQHITREFLVHRGMAGDPVLIMFDNAHLISPIVLEQLRRICAFKVKGRRVLSVVLAGNSDVVRVMDSPAMSQTKFRSHVHFNIRVYTEQETANYVWHHLRLAGGIGGVKFSNEAHPLIYRYTGGNPNLINMLCNGVLTESCAAESRVITENVIRNVADNQRLLPHVVSLQAMGRRRTDPEFELVQPERQTEERILARESTTKEPVEKPAPTPKTPDVDGKNLNECASLQLRIAARKTPEEPVSEGALIAAARKANLDSSTAVAQFEQAIESVPAYQTLKEYEPAAYNCLITTYEQMIGQDYSEQQIKDALRVQQAELLEQRLPRAADEAVINYIRLIVNQLGEFHLLGADLCFKMMVPQNGRGNDVSPVISERTREREFAALDMTLRTYDAQRQIPTEEDVWPDIEPIFEKLFEAFGEDTVSALYDPLAPNIDKVMACNISRSLYSEILKLSENNAVNAMRWILSP